MFKTESDDLCLPRSIRRSLSICLLLLVPALVVGSGPGSAQDETPPPSAAESQDEMSPEQRQAMELFESLEWQSGPQICDLDEIALLDISEEYLFLNGDDARKLMTWYENTPTQREVGLVVRADNPMGWFVVFEFDDVGYVKDDEKDDLDGDELLETFKEGQEQANQERKRAGRAPLYLVGWKTAPRYNDQTQNLEWCLHLESGGQPVYNHEIRLLGRRGHMAVTLVCGPAELDEALAETRTLIGDYQFRDGQKYSQWLSGDKVAEYGLAALVAGGAVALAAKTGLLGKFLKPLLVGVVVVFGVCVRFFKKIFGRE